MLLSACFATFLAIFVRFEALLNAHFAQAAHVPMWLAFVESLVRGTTFFLGLLMFKRQLLTCDYFCVSPISALIVCQLPETLTYVPILTLCLSTTVDATVGIERFRVCNVLLLLTVTTGYGVVAVHAIHSRFQTWPVPLALFVVNATEMLLNAASFFRLEVFGLSLLSVSAIRTIAFLQLLVPVVILLWLATLREPPPGSKQLWILGVGLLVLSRLCRLPWIMGVVQGL